MKIKTLIGSILLFAGMAFGQSQFSGGGGNISIGPGSLTLTKGELAAGTGVAQLMPTPFGIFVSTYCGDASGQTCPKFLNSGSAGDICIAMNQIITDFSCTITGGNSCHIVNDMVGIQTCSQNLPVTATGRLDFWTNGAALDMRLDGIDTWKIPTAFEVHGMGGSASDASAMNTRIDACNPATDNCNMGGFTVQSSSGIAIGLVEAGTNPTATLQITLASGTPFSASTTALNAIGSTTVPRIGRLICLYGTTSNTYDGCWPLLSVQVTGAGQQFTVSWDSTISASSCGSPCGSAVAYLDTPMISIGTGNGTNTSGTFHNRFGDVILDGHLMPGVAGMVNAQGEEGSGIDGSVQMYNMPTYGLRLEESSNYAGNCATGHTCGSLVVGAGATGTIDGIGAANDGPYGAVSINFNPFIVTKGGSGAACTNSGTGDCVGGFVAAGGKITMGSGAANNFALLSGAPKVNPDWMGLMLTGAAGNQGGGPFTRLTVSGQDKTATGATQGMFAAAGATTPVGVYIQGHGDWDFLNIHTEFIQIGVEACGDTAKSVVWNQVYGSVVTNAVKIDTAKLDLYPASGGIMVDIGSTGGTQANCQDIEFGAITGTKGAATGNVLQDNLLGQTIAASATIQSLHYVHGHGVNSVPWISSDATVGIGGGAMYPLDIIPSGSAVGITAASGAINTTETVIAKTGTAMPAGRLLAGTTIRATWIGTCTATVANASTFSIRYGTAGTTSDGLLSQAVTAASAASGTNIPFKAVLEVTIRTTGAAATSYGTLTLYNLGATGIATTAVQVIAATETNINTTTASTFLDATYVSAATTTTSTFQQAYIEVLY